MRHALVGQPDGTVPLLSAIVAFTASPAAFCEHRIRSSISARGRVPLPLVRSLWAFAWCYRDPPPLMSLVDVGDGERARAVRLCPLVQLVSPTHRLSGYCSAL